MCLRNSNDEPVKGEIDCELHDLVLRPIQKPLQNLICVSSHRLLVVDIVMLKTLIKKCFKRFRTSKISRISSLINSYVNKYTKLELNVHLKQKLDTFTKTNDNYCIVSFEEIFEVMQKMIDAVQILKVIVQYVNKSSTELLYWLKLGHFPRQIKILTATLARISIFAKSIAAYAVDVYPLLFTYLEIVNLAKANAATIPRCLKHHLLQMKIKPAKVMQMTTTTSSSNSKRKQRQRETKSQPSFVAIDIGQKISRTVFRNQQQMSGMKQTPKLSPTIKSL